MSRRNSHRNSRGDSHRNSRRDSHRKKSSSAAWLREHREDPFVQRAIRAGYRSRACYKLIEIDDRDGLLKRGAVVVDLGSAPGGWSQVAAERVGDAGKIIASDIRPMDSLSGVTFIQGDFTENDTFERILAEIGCKGADLVISDMAPDMSGMTAVDQPRAVYLVELALDLASRTLKPGGDFLAKVFQGEGFDGLLDEARARFERILTRKPAASRARSREVYLLARSLRRKRV